MTRARPRHVVAKTALGVLLTALMLFPVYWMINVSLTRDQDMRKSPPNLIPGRTARSTATAPCCTSSCPTSAPACSSASARSRSPCVLAAPAGYSLAKLRPRGGGALSFVLLIAQMIPGDRHGDGLLRHLPQARHAQHACWGLIVADSTIAVPFGVLIFTAFMSGIPDELLQAARIDGAGHAAHLLVDRPAGQPQRDRHRLAVRLPVGLVGLRVRQHPRQRRRARSRSPSASTHYIGNNNQQWNAIMATAVVASIPAAVLLVLAQRYVAAGVTAGAVKD